MGDMLEQVLSNLETFLMVFIRISGIFISMPFFSRNDIPSTAKVGFSFMLAFVVTPLLDYNYTSLNYVEFFISIAKESFIGFGIGYVAKLLLSSIYIAGQMISMQVGFAMANVFDPSSNVQVPLIGNLYYSFALTFFLISDGHHIVLKALTDSFEVIKIAQININPALMPRLSVLGAEMFMTGFKIATPIIATIFLANLLLGIMAKTVPQLNVFVVGMPFKILIGFFIMIVFIPLYFLVLDHIYVRIYEEIHNFINYLI